MSDTLDQIKSDLGPACTRCKLCTLGRSQIVFGVGHPKARLMFVGEAPGEEEDKRGEPFVGRAGQLLTKIIEAIGLTREQVYIANVIKCRPPGNRNPEPDEVAPCEPFLFRQIDVIQPMVIVPLGKFAAQCLLQHHRSHHAPARQDVRVSRYDADSDVSPGLPAAQPLGEARSLGGHEEGPRDPAGRNVGADPVSARLVSVAVPVPALGLLTYRIPAGRPMPPPGARVVVPLATRTVTGVVIGVDPAPDSSFAVRDVHDVLDLGAFVPPDVIALTEWVSEYYLAGPGATLASALPPHALTARVDRFKTVRVASITAAGLDAMDRPCARREAT